MRRGPHFTQHLTCRLLFCIREGIGHIWVDGGSKQAQRSTQSISCQYKIDLKTQYEFEYLFLL